MIDALRKGIQKAWDLKNLAVLVSSILIIFAFIFVGTSVAGSLSGSGLSGTQSGDLFSNGFDYLILNDLLNAEPDTFKGISKSVLTFIAIYMLFSIFFNAGIIGSIVNSQYNVESFFKNAAQNFLPFAIYTLLFLMLISIVVFICFSPFRDPITMVQELASDKKFFHLLYVAIIVAICLISIIASWSINTRLFYAIDRKFFTSLRRGFMWTFKRIFPHLGFFLFFLIIGAFMFWINIKLELMTSVWLVFILSILILMVRIFFRFWYFSSLMFYSKNNPVYKLEV